MTFTVTIPSWLMNVTVLAIWIFGCWIALVMRALEGRDRHERLIVIFALVAIWPITMWWALLQLLFRKPS